jgi:hypothetical protein
MLGNHKLVTRADPFAESIERFSGDAFNARPDRAADAKSGAAVVPQEVALGGAR